MVINRDIIEKLNPCKDRLGNFVEKYGNREFSKRQFMGLKFITQADKMWVAFKLMPEGNIRLAAADIAESVLSIYESKYPSDNRPRKAIEASREGDNKDSIDAYHAAYDAVHTASTDAYIAHTPYEAAYAGYAAAHAAAAAYDAPHAHSAACNAAINAADACTTSRLVQEKLIRKICLKYWL